jgi:hypothetical protein
MFVGHIGIGFAAKAASPKTSLGTLVLAATLLDALLWTFVIIGLEHIAVKAGITTTNPLDLYDYPISHSLFMAVFWGVLMAGTYYGIRKYARGALLIFTVVVSHWILDFVSHRRDMPIAAGIHHYYYGLGLYNSRVGMLLVEGLLWSFGIALYERATRSKKRAGIWTLYIGVAILTWLWIGSLNGGAPHATISQIGIISLVFLAITVAWAYVVDKLRLTAAGTSDAPLPCRPPRYPSVASSTNDDQR